MDILTTQQQIIPAHQWTHQGSEVLLLKCIGSDGVSYRGPDKRGVNVEFRYPLEVGKTIEVPDWDPSDSCGGGIHGWAWGIGIGGGKEPNWSQGIWIVLGALPCDVVHITESGHKDKCRKAIVRFVSVAGEWWTATDFVLRGQMAWVAQASSGAASATGGRGAASATGESGAASATGWSGAASATGESGAASATGESGAASATGERGAASATGDASCACVTGMNGRAMGGRYSVVVLSWWNVAEKRPEMRCCEIGCGDGSDGKLKAKVWYRLNAVGNFEEEP